MTTIASRESFREWLRNKPRVVGVAIASRIAMRVLPLGLLADQSSTARSRRMTSAIFRANAISRAWQGSDQESAHPAARAAADSARAAGAASFAEANAVAAVSAAAYAATTIYAASWLSEATTALARATGSLDSSAALNRVRKKASVFR